MGTISPKDQNEVYPNLSEVSDDKANEIEESIANFSEGEKSPKR